jgi:restriction system protein
MSESEQPTSRRPDFIKAASEILSDQGGEMRSRDVMREIELRMQPTAHEAERLEKTGYIRWWAALQLDSIRLVKAGWLRKKRGIWYLTEEGRRQVQLSPGELFRAARERYLKWKRGRAREPDDDDIEGSEETAVAQSAAAFDQAVDLAKTGIQAAIQAMDAYDFQDLVAALLRGMGYHTPFVAPAGKDGGIDILAYRDPFGTEEPRIKVQVKHRRDQKVSAREVRELTSLLNKQGDTGLMVSTAGFTADAMTEVRHAQMHIETVDLDKLIELWESYYERLAEEDKALLPLRRIAFVAPLQD